MIQNGTWNDAAAWSDAATWDDGPGILENGAWNDAAAWNDANPWLDGAVASSGILETGAWNDAGTWKDSEPWREGAGILETGFWDDAGTWSDLAPWQESAANVFGSLAGVEAGRDTFAGILQTDVRVGFMVALEQGADSATITGALRVLALLAASETGVDTLAASGQASSRSGSMSAAESLGADLLDASGWVYMPELGSINTRSHVLLDRPVLIEAGKNYLFMVKHDRLQRATGTIAGVVANNIITVTGYTTGLPVKRLSHNGRDYQVVDSGNNWLQLDTVAFIFTGGSYTLFDTDVIEERSVLYASAGEKTELELNGPLAQAPEPNSQWMFGESSKIKKVFRIKTISTALSDGSREISAIQYDPQIYSYSRFGAQFSPGGVVIDLSKAPIGQVRNLDLYEQTFIAGGALRTEVIVAWQTPQTGRYAGADVYLSVNGSPATKHVINNRHSATFPAARGQTITAKVAAFDIFGNRVAYAGAPEKSYRIIGELTGIDVGQVSAPDVVWNGRDCRLSWRYNSQTHSYEFGSEPLNVGADAGALDPHFKDYEVRVWQPDRVDPVRIEYTTQSNYTYTYEKNFNDGLSRRLTFEIRMRDIFNNLGKPVRLVAENLAPRLQSLHISANFEAAQVFIEPTADTDFSGVMVWVAETPEEIAGDIYSSGMTQHVRYNGVDKIAYVTGLMPNRQYYLRAVAYDVFGFTELVPSNVFPFKTTFMNVEAIAEGVLSESLLIPALQERINLIDGPVEMEGSVANLVAESETRIVGPNGAMAQTVSQIEARVQEAEAKIIEESTARATQDSAIATQITQLSSTIGDNNASVEQMISTVDGLKVQYTVKIDNNGYIAGFGLASTPVNGVPTSEFVVRADRFAIIIPSGPGQNASYAQPFTVGNVNGIARVIISSALIGDATINTAKIVDAAITNAKILDGQITNAKIAADIRSLNYVQGVQGWAINKSGLYTHPSGRSIMAEFNGVVISRPNVVASGTWTQGQQVGGIGYLSVQDLITDTAQIAPYYQVLIDTGYDDNRAINDVTRPALVAKAVVTGGVAWYSVNPGSGRYYTVSVDAELYSSLDHYLTGSSGPVAGRIYIKANIRLTNIATNGPDGGQIISAFQPTFIQWSLMTIS